MTRLILETSLLLLGAYFLGAWVACLVKRSFFANAQPVTAGVQFAPAAATARSGVAGPAMPVPPPVRRADPKPIALETIERTSPQAAENAANRFEQVLTKMPVADAAARVPKPAPAPTPAAPPVNRVAPAGAPVGSPSPMPSIPVPAGTSAVTAEPVTVAATAATAVMTPSAPAVTPAAPTRPDLPASSTTSGPASVAAPIAASAKAAAPAQTAPVASVAPAAVVATRVAAPATQPRVADLAAFAQTAKAPVAPAQVTPAAPRQAAKVAAPIDTQGAIARATEPGLAGAAASAAAAGLGTLSSTRDNLQRIGGINAEVEKLLNTQNVSRYAQVTTWTAADTMRFDRLLGQEGRVKRENWIEQAQILSRGGDTAYSRQFDQRFAPAAAGVTADVARPSRLSDAIRDTAAKTVAEPVSAPRGADMSGLRSVRSEAYAGAGKIGAQAAQVDDLKRIRGVGVLIEKKLNSMGVTSYQQIANWSASDIDRVSQVLDFRGRIERENWVEQARILSAGGQTEFSRRVDRGEVETSKNR